MALLLDNIEKEIIANRKELTRYVDIDKVKYENLDKRGGIYVFWYHNKNKKIKNLKRELTISGPGKVKMPLEWNWNINEEYICLYIGKTTNISSRIKQHLLLRTDNLKSKNDNQLNKINTTCQLRSGFDYLYSDRDADVKNELKRHLYLSIYYEDDFIERFFAEDYFIGKLKPWFNVDSER